MKKILLSIFALFAFTAHAQDKELTKKLMFSVGYRANDLDFNKELEKQGITKINQSMITMGLSENWEKGDFRWGVNLDLLISLPKKSNGIEASQYGTALFMDASWRVINHEKWEMLPTAMFGFSANKASITRTNSVDEDEKFMPNSLNLENNYFFAGAALDFKIAKQSDFPVILTIGTEYPLFNNKWKASGSHQNFVRETKGKFFVKLKFDLN